MAKSRKKLHKPKRMDSIRKTLKRIKQNSDLLNKLKNNDL
jgi:hypothetical protein